MLRYKNEIRAEDKAALQKLMKRQYHYLVTPEVHRELEASRWFFPCACRASGHL